MEITLPPLQTTQDLPDIEFTATKQDRFENNQYAPISNRTQKILHKLQKRLNAMDEKFTEERLKHTKEKIHQWIDRHSAQRIPVKKKSLHLFTGGKDYAPASKKINSMREQLRAGFYGALAASSKTPSPDLKGRVKKS